MLREMILDSMHSDTNIAVVNMPNSYYVFTTFEGINLPCFANFVIFLTASTEKANLANRAKTRQIKAL